MDPPVACRQGEGLQGERGGRASVGVEVGDGVLGVGQQDDVGSFLANECDQSVADRSSLGSVELPVVGVEVGDLCDAQLRCSGADHRSGLLTGEQDRGEGAVPVRGVAGEGPADLGDLEAVGGESEHAGHGGTSTRDE